MNPSLRDPDLIFTDNKRLVIGNVCVGACRFQSRYVTRLPVTA
jgi:hypothetical protein